MIPVSVRQNIRRWFEEAIKAGARRSRAMAIIGLSVRCIMRWRDDDIDRRTVRIQAPRNAFSEAEVAQVLDTVNSAPFANLPPTQIVPILADQGRYIGSESTIYRILRKAQQLAHRRSSKAPKPRVVPKTLIASGAGQVATWDITYLPTAVRGQYWYLYVVQDLFSHKAVAWQVYAEESAEHASSLLRDYAARESIEPDQLTLHADNGAVMKGSTLYATLHDLKIATSHSRPSVSNDNPFIEALFRTIKYRPENPLRPFATLADARHFAELLLTWYNSQHRHSSIHYVTPDQRHAGEDTALLELRKALYESAKAANPGRWSGDTRNWDRKSTVHLNPDRVERVIVRDDDQLSANKPRKRNKPRVKTAA